MEILELKIMSEMKNWPEDSTNLRWHKKTQWILKFINRNYCFIEQEKNNEEMWKNEEL